MAFSVALLAMAWLVFAAAPANAALTHSTVEKKFPIGPECTSGAGDIAVAESSSLIYVVCEIAGHHVIKRFHPDGSPAPFSFEAPYISGNKITGNPQSAELTFNGIGVFDFPTIAVDNSPIHNGFLFVSAGCGGCRVQTGQEVEVFAPSGQWVYEFPTSVAEGDAVGVDVARTDGTVYVLDQPNSGAPGEGKIRKYDASSFSEVRRLYSEKIRDRLAVDSNGSIWSSWQEDTSHPFEEGYKFIAKWEPDQFTTNLTTGVNHVEGVPEAVTSPFMVPGLLPYPPGSGNFVAIDVDPANDDLYFDSGNMITPYTSGGAEELVHKSGPAFGTGGVLSKSRGVFVAVDGHVYATTNGTEESPAAEVVIFGPGAILPNIRTPAPQINDIGHIDATVRAHVDRIGGAPITSCEVQYGTEAPAYGSSVPCSPDPALNPPASNFEAATTDVSAHLTGLATGTTYHYRFVAGNEHGSNFGGDRTVTPVFVIKLNTEDVTEISTHEATLHGSFDADGINGTKYFFEYGLDDTYGEETAEVAVPSAPGAQHVAAAIANLPAGRTIHYRIAARNENGVTYGSDKAFRVASAPAVSGLRATEVRATSAILNAQIDPIGYDTTYRFEYGTTPEYGSIVPVPDQDVGADSSPESVTQQVANLQPGFTYHFRVVAQNKWGTTMGDDTTFDFSPPNCPNSHVRQQTGTSYLPDCRAYELVSPGNANGVLFFPTREVRVLSETILTSFPGLSLWAVNRGLANNPSRFAYIGSLGSLPDQNAPNGLFDMYMATRTPNGWVTSVPGLKASETIAVGQKQCSDSMDLCIDHDPGDVFARTSTEQVAPFLFTASGEPRGRLPTNVNEVSGGKTFEGDQRPSYDFSHFAFSSRSAVFAEGGLHTSPGSAYDNDIAAKTVELISLKGSHEPIPQDTGPVESIGLPGISTNGSHILMSVQGIGGPVHLYMRVGGGGPLGVTYDVSRGAGVTFVGMTRDGKKVLFTATQKLTPDDTDTSADLFLWNEEGDTLTRISTGNGQGDSDACAPSWTSGCSVAPLTTEVENPIGLSSVPGLDDRIARESGDVYFYSPELLDAGSPGIRNQRNLYVFHKGAVHLVATLDPGTQINRMQISPEGRYAGFVTASRLTGYDNHGFKEMYTYDAETGAIRCASCRPDGIAPTVSVEASQGGPFMADDGRVFFSTKDALVPQDTDGGIIDVYEYAGGRPQLISSGTGTRDSTGGGGSNVFFPAVNTGLESVSADGVDVIFSTYDTLVSQDTNGPFIKFYDARTGGGFEPDPDLASCEAADECHGVGNSPPSPTNIATDGNFGETGNTVTVTKHKKKKHKNRHKRGRGQRAAHVGRNGH